MVLDRPHVRRRVGGRPQGNSRRFDSQKTRCTRHRTVICAALKGRIAAVPWRLVRRFHRDPGVHCARRLGGGTRNNRAAHHGERDEQSEQQPDHSLTVKPSYGPDQDLAPWGPVCFSAPLFSKSGRGGTYDEEWRARTSAHEQSHADARSAYCMVIEIEPMAA